jgi:hypothetical protein
MKADCRSPAMAFSPWGEMPLAIRVNPAGAHRDLGGSECASVESFRAPVCGSNRREGSLTDECKSGARPGKSTARERNAC